MKIRLNVILSGSDLLKDQEVAWVPQLITVSTQLLLFNVNFSHTTTRGDRGDPNLGVPFQSFPKMLIIPERYIYEDNRDTNSTKQLIFSPKLLSAS